MCVCGEVGAGGGEGQDTSARVSSTPPSISSDVMQYVTKIDKIKQSC